MAQNNKNIDMPIPEVKTPILAPVKIKKELIASGIKKEVKERLNAFVKKDLNKIETTSLEEFLKYIIKIYGKNAIKKKEKAMRGYLTSYKITNKEKIGPKVFFNKWKIQMLNLLKAREKPIKARFILEVEFYKKINKEIITTFAYFHTFNEIITESTDLKEVYNKKVKLILEKIYVFVDAGSGWIFERIISLDIHIDKYKPLNGRSFIPLPKELANKKAIINVKNKDNECFKWAITSALYPQEEHSNRLTKVLRTNSEKLN